MFDFDEMIDRRDTNSMKWNVLEKELPMWVADMDFKTAPVVVEAVEKRARHGIYGYAEAPDLWKQAIIQWWEKRHSFHIHEEWLMFTTGIVPAISCAVERLTNLGDQVLVQSPVYSIFFNSIENHGRHAIENQLIYQNHSYSIDFEDLEKKLSHPLTSLMILCNPHNPTGNVWSKDELSKIGKMCKEHHVTVLADEIHCDLTAPGVEYIPFASVSEDCASISVTCISATKTFNIAGLQTAAVMIPSRPLFQKMERGLNSNEIAEPNIFACEATMAAFLHGASWLDGLRDYIDVNKQTVSDFLDHELPELSLVASKATYLLWIDCSKITTNTSKLCDVIRRETGLYLSKGKPFRGNGILFVRMNIACPRERLQDGLQRLKKGVQCYLDTCSNKYE